jgi:hypothetical protein
VVVVSLIAISDVEGVFNDEIVKELAQTAKLPADADMARFAQSIRISARIFLEKKQIEFSATTDRDRTALPTQ